jgi:hypothetical protein
MSSIAMKKDNMNKFSVVKDILAICGDSFSEETRQEWMGILIDRGNDILSDLYNVPGNGATTTATEEEKTPSIKSSWKQEPRNSNSNQTPSIKAAVVKDSSNKSYSSNSSNSSSSSSSSSSNSSSNLVSQTQSSKKEKPRTSNNTSAIKLPETSIIPTTITKMKSVATQEVPGSIETNRITNADLEFEEKAKKERPTKKGISILLCP